MNRLSAILFSAIFITGMTIQTSAQKEQEK